MVFPDPSLSQAEKLQISQFAFVGEVLQTSEHPLQQLHVFLMLEAPVLDAVLLMGPHKYRAERTVISLSLWPPPSFDAVQDTVDLPSC